MFHAVRLFTLRLLRKVVNKIKRKFVIGPFRDFRVGLIIKKKKNCLFIVFTRVLTVHLLNFERRVCLIIRVTIPFATFVARHCVLCDFRRSIRKLRISVCDTCVCPFLSHPFESVCSHFVPFSLLSIHFTQSLS